MSSLAVPGGDNVLCFGLIGAYNSAYCGIDCEARPDLMPKNT